MDISSIFNFGGNKTNHVDAEIPNIYPFSFGGSSFLSADFVRTDIMTIYSKILVDTLERTHGLDADLMDFLFDNCLESESSEGLITILSDAMYNKKEVFLVYNASLGVLRKADQSETALIKKDYAERGESAVGFYISFKQYKKTDMLKIYSYLEYGLLCGLHKSISLSTAIQLKFTDMRASVNVIDQDMVIKQANKIAQSLSNGKDVAIDAKDLIETARPDLTSMQTGLDFLNQKRAFLLGLPQSYIEGTLQKGMGDSGQGDAKAIDRGLKGYFFSIIKPVLGSIFQTDITYKPHDNSDIRDSLEVLKTFELTSDELLPQEEKQRIIYSLFDVEA